MALQDCLRFYLPELCAIGALGKLGCTARMWFCQTKKAMAKAVMQTRLDVDQLCVRHRQSFPSFQRIQFLALRNISCHVMDRRTWTEVCRLQCCLSEIRRIAESHLEDVTLRAILEYLVQGMVNNIRIHEGTLLDLYNEAVGSCHEHIHRDLLDNECTDAIGRFSQTWSRSCVDCDFTIGSVLVALFKAKIELDCQRLIACCHD